jgi:hypothetical protein
MAAEHLAAAKRLGVEVVTAAAVTERNSFDDFGNWTAHYPCLKI